MFKVSRPYALWQACQTSLLNLTREQFLRHAIACATLAANTHNTQPWKLQIFPDPSGGATQNAVSEASPRSIQILPD